MRIVGRSESPSFPLLETLLPMEKSWALEVEREEETWCLQVKNGRPGRDTESVNQIESSWVSCKRLNSGSKEASHRSHARENELHSKRASRSFDSKPHRDDNLDVSLRNSGDNRRAWQFTSSSRCYPPSVHVKSSEFSASAERRGPRLQTQRGMHETRKFSKPDRTNDSFACRKHSMRSNNGSSSEGQGVKPSANILERRQGHSAWRNDGAEMTSVYEASEKHGEHAGGLSHIQDHQQLDDCKHEVQSLFGKRSQYLHGQYFVKSGFSGDRSRHRYVQKMGQQGPCHHVTDWKDAKNCERFMESDMKQQIEAIIEEQSFDEKPGITNGNDGAPEAVIGKESALPEGNHMFDSSCTEESEVKNDNFMLDKKQYEALASLLFDGLQDISEDFDATIVGDGSDCEYSGSIFDVDWDASMEIDVVEGKGTSGKVPAVCTTVHLDCNSVEASAVKSSASQHAKKLHNRCTSSGLKQSPSVLVDVTNKFEIHASPGVKGDVEEDDLHRLSQRQRQIEFGKNTLGYECYSELIPRIKRKAKDPQTPNPKQVCSKRSWDGQIRKWRRLLHAYDPPSEDGEEIAEDFSILKLHRSKLEDAKEDTSPDFRFAAESDENSCNGVADRKIVGDANLSIYDDWMES